MRGAVDDARDGTARYSSFTKSKALFQFACEFVCTIQYLLAAIRPFKLPPAQHGHKIKASQSSNKLCTAANKDTAANVGPAHESDATNRLILAQTIRGSI